MDSRRKQDDAPNIERMASCCSRGRPNEELLANRCISVVLREYVGQNRRIYRYEAQLTFLMNG